MLSRARLKLEPAQFHLLKAKSITGLKSKYLHHVVAGMSSANEKARQQELTGLGSNSPDGFHLSRKTLHEVQLNRDHYDMR